MVKKMLVLFVFFVGCSLCGMEKTQDLISLKKNIEKKIRESQKRSKKEKGNKKKLNKEELRHEDFSLLSSIVHFDQNQNSTSEEECAYTPVKYDSGKKSHFFHGGGLAKKKSNKDAILKSMMDSVDLIVKANVELQSEQEHKKCKEVYIKCLTKNFKQRLTVLRKDTLFKQLKENGNGDELFAKHKNKWEEISKIVPAKKPDLLAYVEYKSIQEMKQTYQELIKKKDSDKVTL